MTEKVLLGTPSGDYMATVTASGIAALVAAKNLLWANMVGTYVERNQNLIVDYAFEQGCSHIMFIDCDMIFPPTILDRLLSHKRDIVGCTYRTRQAPYEFASVGLDGQHSTGQETGVREVLFIPSGMMLVRRKVFEITKFPWFYNVYGEKSEDFVGNDVNFCMDARDAGLHVYCDFFASRDIKHFGQKALGWNL